MPLRMSYKSVWKWGEIDELNAIELEVHPKEL